MLSECSLQLRSDKNSILANSLYHLLHHSSEEHLIQTLIFLGFLVERFMSNTHQRNRAVRRSLYSLLFSLICTCFHKNIIFIVLFSVWTVLWAPRQTIAASKYASGCKLWECSTITLATKFFFCHVSVYWFCSSFPLLLILTRVKLAQ